MGNEEVKRSSYWWWKNSGSNRFQGQNRIFVSRTPKLLVEGSRLTMTHTTEYVKKVWNFFHILYFIGARKIGWSNNGDDWYKQPSRCRWKIELLSAMFKANIWSIKGEPVRLRFLYMYIYIYITILQFFIKYWTEFLLKKYFQFN